MSVKILGEKLDNMPWQDKPHGSGLVWRHNANPITGWNETEKAARIFNSAVIPYEGYFVGVFRADQRIGKPFLHFGRSRDALHWEFENEEIHWKDEMGNDFDPAYAYDPRLVKVEDAYYVTWCTGFGGAPTIGIGRTQDFTSFTRLPNVFLPCNRNGVLFPRRVGGKYLMLSRPSDTGHTPFGDIYLSESPDLVHWGMHKKVMSRHSNWWQNLKIGPGPTPIETTEGWLLFYHGVTNTCNGYVYSMGAAILDLKEPSKVLYRTKAYLLTPEMPYEITGFVPNVVFPCATLHDAATGRIAIYYGAADTYVGIAYTEVNELVEYIKANSDLMDGDTE